MNHQKEQMHQAKIVEQFSRQAIPFTQVPGHFDAMQILIELSEVCRADSVLDVACGPGSQYPEDSSANEENLLGCGCSQRIKWALSADW